jgi:hypothetical protein
MFFVSPILTHLGGICLSRIQVKKDIFDNISHKPDVLAHKDTLEDVVDMLNELLPEIV